MNTHQQHTSQESSPGRALSDAAQYMTGAELQTLREACHLTRDELGDLCGVAARSVKHWESGRSGVPADVAALVRTMHIAIEDRARDLARQLAHDLARDMAHDLGRATPRAAPPVLVRYRTTQDLRQHRPDLARWHASTWAAVVARVVQALSTQGPAVRVVWFDPQDYAQWQQGSAPGASMQAWCADAIKAQAMPHRADQPPEM